MNFTAVMRRTANVVLVSCGIASIAATGGSTGGTEGAAGALPTWAKSFGGPGEDIANGVTRTADGGYLFVGQRNGSGVRRGSQFATGDEAADLWVVKLDSFGDRVWERVLSGPSGALPNGVSRDYQKVVGAQDGSVWLLGQETQRETEPDARDIVRADAVVTRLDANGNVQWTQTYDSGPYPNGAPNDGDSSNDDDDAIAFVSATRGTVAETILSASPSDDGGLVLAMLLNADVVVTEIREGGNAASNASASAVYVLKIGSDGSAGWHQYYQDGPLNKWWAGSAIVRAIADDGALLATTNHSPTGGVRDRGARLVRMAPGSIRWIESLGRLQPLDVVMLDHGDAAIVGRRRSVDFSLEPDAAVVRLVDRGDHGEFESIIEIDEGTDTVAVAPDCEVRDGWHHFDSELQQEIHRCGIVVLAQKRPDGAGALQDGVLAARISPDGDIEKLVSIPGVRSACGLKRLPDALLDGSAAFAGLFATTADPMGPGVAISLNSELAVAPNVAAASMPACPPAGESGSPDTSMWVTAAATLLRLSEATSSSSTNLTVTRIDGSVVHQREFVSGDGLRIARAMSVAQTDDDSDGVADDGYIVAADIVESVTGSNISPNLPAGLIKLDEQGSIEWQMRYPGVTFSPGGLVGLERVVQSKRPGSNAADGFVFVANGPAAFDETPGLAGTHLVKTDLLGNPVWVGDALGRPNASVRAIATVSRTADGGFVVAGAEPAGTETEVSSQYGWIARVSDDGNLLWRTSFPAYIGLTAARETPSGQFIAGGIAGDDPIAVLFDDVGGIVWSRRYPAAGSFAGPVTRIEPLGANDFVMGTTRRLVSVQDDDTRLANNGGDLSVLRLHDDGSIAWHNAYGGLQDDVLTSLAVTSDDGVLLGAYSDSVGDRRDAWLLRLSPEGNVAPGCNAVLSSSRFQPIPTDATLRAQSELTSSEGSEAPVVPAVLAAQLSVTNAEDTVIARQCAGTTTPPGSAPNEPTFTLRVTQIGTGTGVISSVPAGIVCGTATGVGCEARFATNSRVSLSLDPLAANHFIGWRDCDAVVGNRCDVEMTSDRAVLVDFADSVSLTIASISGQGRVVGDAGIDCRAGVANSTCGATVTRGTRLSLTAAPSAGRTFIGWGGACSSSSLVLPVPMFESKTCTANFSGAPPGSPFVSVAVAPPDRGRVVSDPAGISCAGTSDVCSDQFVRDGAVTLTADAFQAGWEFDRYQCSGSVPNDVGSRTLHIPSLTSDVSCIARFSPTIERLYVRILVDLNAASPPGRVVSDPVSLDCRADCDRPFMRDQLVTLRALPDSNFAFTTWAGCDRTYPEAAAPDVCEVRLSTQRNVVAFFAAQRIGGDGLRQLAVNFAPGSAMGIVTSSPGSIDCSPSDGICVGTFTVGEVVDLALAPFGGSALASNDGCDVFTPAGPGLANCRVTMTLDRVVTFGFTRTNTPPIAAFTFGPPVPQTGQLIVFDAASSTDDTGVAAYRWDYGNNGSFDAAGTTVSRSFALAGDYVVRLQVEDLDGVRDETVRTVTVVQPPPQSALLTMYVSGNGSVVSTPAGIDCVGSQPCSASFPLGTVVSLAATPNGGATFAGFSGDPDCADGNVTIVANLTCTADFFASNAQWTQRGGALNVTSSLEAAFAGSPDAYTDGNPVSAFQENGLAVVRRWDGSAWIALGSPLGNGTVGIVSVSIDSSGAPVVAWDESDDTVSNGTRNVSAARWSDNAWGVLGSAPVDLQIDDDAHTPTIRARSGDVALAWVESDPAGGSHVVVRLWNGTQWLNAGSAPGPQQTEQGADSSGSTLAVGPTGEMAVAWVEGFASPNVAELIGGVWTTTTAPLAAPMSGTTLMSDLAYSTSEGLLYVAVQQGGPGGFQVRSWRAGSWTDLGAAHAPGRLMFGLAFSHNRTGAMPLLAYGYRDNGLSSVHAYAVERWSGTGWSALGNPIDPIDRHGQSTFEAEVAIVDGAVPVLVTYVRGHLPGTATSDHAVVAFGYR